MYPRKSRLLDQHVAPVGALVLGRRRVTDMQPECWADGVRRAATMW